MVILLHGYSEFRVQNTCFPNRHITLKGPEGGSGWLEYTTNLYIFLFNY